MRISIRTPEGELFSQENVRSIDAFTELGELRILPGHAALQGTVAFSPIRIETKEKTEQFVIQQGLVVVDPSSDEVRFFAYKAEPRSQLNHETAKAYLDRLLQALRRQESLSDYALKFLDSERIATEERISYLTANPNA